VDYLMKQTCSDFFRHRHGQVQVPDRFRPRDLQQYQVLHEGRVCSLHRNQDSEVLQEGKWLPLRSNFENSYFIFITTVEISTQVSKLLICYSTNCNFPLFLSVSVDPG
jgi:hypothetical protein